MPLFEYKCEACLHQFEELVRGEPTAVICPRCTSTKTRKQLSLFATSGGSSSSAYPCGQSGCSTGGFT